MESSRPVSRLERRDIAGSAKDFLRFTDEDVEYIELDLLRCPPMIARQSTLPYAVMAAATPNVELVCAAKTTARLQHARPEADLTRRCSQALRIKPPPRYPCVGV